MKATTMQSYYRCASPRPTAHRYPNAAPWRYFLEKAVDALLAAAITLAVITIFLFVLTAL